MFLLLQLIVAVAAGFAVFVVRRWWHFRLFRRLGIPGPKPSLLFGNVKDIQQVGFTNMYTEWHNRFGNIYGYFFGIMPVIVTTDADLLHRVIFKDAQLFYHRLMQFNLDAPHPVAGRQIQVTRNPDEVKGLRTHFTSSFTTSGLRAALEPIKVAMAVFIRRLLEESGDEIEITDFLRRLAMDTSCRIAFGLGFRLQEKGEELPVIMRQCEHVLDQDLSSMRELLSVSVSPKVMLPVFWVAYALKLMAHKFDPLVKTLGAVVAARKQGHTQSTDIMDALLRKPLLGRPTTQNEVLANATFAFIAGFDTTSTLISVVVFRLARHQDWQHKLRCELQQSEKSGHQYDNLASLKLLDMFISECLRLDPPAPSVVTREAIKDYRYKDFFCPKGTTIQAPVTVLHRDPTIYPEPDTFDPMHFAHHIPAIYFMPFGEGLRLCVGMRFAMMQAKLVAAELLANFRISLGHGYENLTNLPLRDSGIVRRPEPFKVKLEPISA